VNLEKLRVRQHLVLGPDLEISRSLDDELLFRLFVDFLGEFGDKQDERTEKVLVNFGHCVQTAVFEDRTHHTFEDVTQNLWCFKRLNFSFIEIEVRLDEGKVQVIINVLLRDLLLCSVIVDDVLMEAEKDGQLGENLVFNKLDLGLVGVVWTKVFSKLVLLVQIFFKVPLE